jgi:hypothetical protein
MILMLANRMGGAASARQNSNPSVSASTRAIEGDEHNTSNQYGNADPSCSIANLCTALSRRLRSLQIRISLAISCSARRFRFFNAEMTVFGIGDGLFVIFFFALISAAICIFGARTKTPGY